MLEIENMKYSVKNLVKRKTRSLLTILSIFIGIVMIFIFISFGWGLSDYVNTIASESGADKFIVQAKGVGAPGIDQTVKLFDDDVEAVEKTKGVAELAAYYFRSFEVEKDGKKVYVYGIAHNGENLPKQLMIELNSISGIEVGRDLKKGETGKTVLGYNYGLKDKVFEKPVKLGDKILINGRKLEVIGFYPSVGNPQDDTNVFVTDEELKLMFSDEDLSYAMIIGRVANKDKIDATIEDIEKSLRRERGLKEGKEDFYVQSFQELIDQFSTALDIIIGFIVLIALISVIVSAVNTTNTMVTSVLERTKEIGIMKAVGARNSVIRNIFLFESSLLGLVAGVLGITAGYICTEIGKAALIGVGYGFLQPHYSPMLFFGAILFSTVVGTISGVAVAIQASKQNPVDSLRYE